MVLRRFPGRRARAAGVRVHELGPAKPLEPFIDVVWRVNRGDLAWVPPLRRNVKALLDRRRHPFHRHAEVAYFIARRDREVVGRIAAILNRRHNEFHRERTGFFRILRRCERRRCGRIAAPGRGELAPDTGA